MAASVDQKVESFISKDLENYETELAEPYGSHSLAYDKYMKDRDDDIVRASKAQEAEFALQ